MSRQVAAKAEAFQKMNKREIFCFLFGLTSRSPRATNLGRWPTVHFNKDGVEPSQAPKARLHRYLGHRQAGLVQEAFSSLHPCGPCHF